LKKLLSRVVVFIALLKKFLKQLAVLGTTILSTSKGVMSDTDARTQKVGGEVLISVF
jgi:ribosomal protein S8